MIFRAPRLGNYPSRAETKACTWPGTREIVAIARRQRGNRHDAEEQAPWPHYTAHRNPQHDAYGAARSLCAKCAARGGGFASMGNVPRCRLWFLLQLSRQLEAHRLARWQPSDADQR